MITIFIWLQYFSSYLLKWKQYFKKDYHSEWVVTKKIVISVANQILHKLFYLQNWFTSHYIFSEKYVNNENSIVDIYLIFNVKYVRLIMSFICCKITNVILTDN